MNKTQRMLWVVMVVLFTIWQPLLHAATDDAGSDVFAANFYHQLAAQTGNLFVSPYSASCALGMTFQGARGQTADEIARALAIPRGKSPEVFSALSRPGAFQPNVLVVANALWVDQAFHVRPDFVHVLQEDFEAGLFTSDFHHQPEAARQQINDWVADKTGQHIEDLIPRGAIDPSTKAVLANAIYFKGIWAAPFNKAATRDQPFTTADGEKIMLSLMHSSVHAEGYFEQPGFQALELAYASNRLSMVVFLPHDPARLTGLEEQMTPEHLTNWLAALEPREVEVYLPRFKLETGFQLNPALEAMGIHLAFTDAANFSGIETLNDGKLEISAVFEKAFVEVNEEGTEAAAATGVVMAPLVVIRRQTLPVFRADHPFLFLIRDRKTNTIIFMGRLTRSAP